MNKVFNKIKEARLLLGLSQQEMADQSGISQRDISQLEAGKREFIPTCIIQLLNKKGIDANSLYDDNKKVQLQRVKTSKNVELNVEPIVEVTNEKEAIKDMKDQLKSKDAIIAAHEDTIKSLKREVALQNKLIQLMEGKSDGQSKAN